MSDHFSLNSIGQIAIVVKDVDRATGFYRDVLGMNFLFQFPGMSFFDCGGVRLYLTRPSSPEYDHTSIVYYRVPSIAEAFETLKARGVEFIEPPHIVHSDERHELWMAAFKDTEGNYLQLMAEVGKTVPQG